MLPGMVPVIGHSPAEISYRTTVVDTNNITSGSYSFASVDIGTASADRLVVISLISAGGGTWGTPTIGGSNATEVRQNNGQTGVWQRLVTSGTTATITVPHASGTMNRMSVSVWALYKLQSITAASTDNVASGTSRNSMTGTVAVRKGGVLVVVARSDQGENITWTGATERYDVTEEATQRSSTADASPTADSGSYNATAAWTTNGSVNGLTVAAWR